LAPDAISNGFSTFYFGGDDVVYAYTPEEDGMIDVNLNNHGTWVGMFVITGCPFESTVGSHTASDNLGRDIEMLPVTAGTTYYIVISTFPAPQSTAYDLSINVSGFDCPDFEADFGDACDDGDDDTINDQITTDCECAGTPAPTSQCGEYTSAPDLAFGTNQAIITDEIEVSGTSGTLTDLNVVLVIDHIWTADVEARLTSPSGAQVDLVIGECGSGDNINVLMDDDGPALSCETGSIPVLFGTFAPEGSLADFNGEDFNGTWTLEVEDNFAAIDDGTLVSWCLIPTLESTVNEECENAMVIGATPEFAGSVTPASMANAVASGDAQCINAENPQADMWFAFESVTTNMYVRAWGLNDFDAAVEVYDSCGGELLNCQNDEPAGEREVVIITNTTVGETYYFRVYHAGDAAPVEQNYTVAVAHIPFTQLSDDDCGVFNYTPANMITTDLPVNQFLLTNWYFEFTELEAPFNTYEILSPNGANPNFLLQWFNDAEYGRTYEVRTRARMYQGPQWGDYGDACTIGFSSVPLTTQLIEEQALGFYDMCDVLEADNVPGAEGYRWKFYDGINPAIQYDSPTRFCQLDLVGGLSLGSPYGVAIRAYTQGVLAPQGLLRLIAMNNFVPDTQLDGAITDCGATYPLNTVVSAVNICAAEFYTFRFTNVTDANQADLFYTRDDGLRSINLTWVTGLNPGDTYSVQLLGGSGGLVGEYGDACEITIAGGANGLVELDEGSTEQLSDVAIELYPNPTTGEEVMMNLSNLSQEQQEVMVEVYDLYGKKVHAEILGNNGSQMNAVIRLPELASGIYTVNVVVNEERVGAKKLVVR
jgi:subtilisin-like proprotein convertase family protein